MTAREFGLVAIALLTGFLMGHDRATTDYAARDLQTRPLVKVELGKIGCDEDEVVRRILEP